VQGAVHRALVGDLQKLRFLRVVEVAFQRQDAVDAIDLRSLCLAILAVGNVNFAVFEIDADVT
jgi:hypothetical protein